MNVKVSGNVKLIDRVYVADVNGLARIFIDTAEKHADLSLACEDGDRIFVIHPSDDSGDACYVRLNIPGQRTNDLALYFSNESRYTIEAILVPYLSNGTIVWERKKT